jgi:hypothetical protein
MADGGAIEDANVVDVKVYPSAQAEHGQRAR